LYSKLWSSLGICRFVTLSPLLFSPFDPPLSRLRQTNSILLRSNSLGANGSPLIVGYLDPSLARVDMNRTSRGNALPLQRRTVIRQLFYSMSVRLQSMSLSVPESVFRGGNSVRKHIRSNAVSRKHGLRRMESRHLQMRVSG